MLQPTMHLRWLQVHRGSVRQFRPGIMTNDDFHVQYLQQKWEHPNNVDDEGLPHLGEWRDIGVERE